MKISSNLVMAIICAIAFFVLLGIDYGVKLYGFTPTQEFKLTMRILAAIFLIMAVGFIGKRIHRRRIMSHWS